MDETLLYLKPNIKVEPLVDRWYAWSHLIPPATAARNITGRHLKIMDSYIASPEIHAGAVKNPKMLGGPFVDYGGKRVDEIRALRDDIVRNRPHLLELSEAIERLDKTLLATAKGHSLEPLYAQVPDPLRGYVELVYDLNNQPSFRLLEALLYRSQYYDRGMQSIMLETITGDDRPFVLSTPRLDTPDAIHWPVSFEDTRVDALFGLAQTPQPYAWIRDQGLADGNDRLLRSFLTDTPPAPYQPYQGKTARWRYFGHACVLVETPGCSILFDPVLSYTYDSQVSRYTYRDLPPVIDYVLITHNHQDHVLFETLLQIRRKVRHVVVPRGGASLQDPSLRLLLQAVGFDSVIEIGDLETIRFDNGTITGLPFFGEHADLDVRSKSAYLVKVANHSLLFAADSCNVEPRLYQHIHKEIGDVDALFLGMECVGAPLSWLYGPLLTQRLERGMDESRRLSGSNFEQGRDIIEALNCREIYIYAMGQEPWLNYVMSLKYTEQSKPIVDSNQLIRVCRARGLRAERLFGEREMFLDG